jgi:hypothetical protein
MFGRPSEAKFYYLPNLKGARVAPFFVACDGMSFLFCSAISAMFGAIRRFRGNPRQSG